MKNEPAAAPPGGFYVTIATAAGSTTKRVEGDLLTVGRADDCHLTISHETLSRRHLSVTLKDAACWIEDHGSSNGTFVNGKRVKPHVLTRVLPEDQITMGTASVRLSVSAEPVMRKEGAPPLPFDAEDIGGSAPDTIVTSTSYHRREARKSQPPPMAKPKDEAQEQAEQLLQDAQKKAALMIQEAEIEAERRVEDIYRRAHETQAKMDEVYQRRMNEAYRSSEQIYQKSQEESQRILDAARQRSTEIRLQAENFVADLRRRTEEDCERMLEEAQQTARDLKEQRLLEAEDIIKKKEEELIGHTREAMNDRMARFEEDLAKEAARSREQLEAELNDMRAQLELDHKDTIEGLKRLKAETKELMDLKAREETALADMQAELRKQSSLSGELKLEIDSAKHSIVEFNQELCDLRTDIEKMKKEREGVDKLVKTAQETLTRLNDEVRTAEKRVKAAHDEAEAELVQVRATLQDTKAKFEKDEQNHLEELKLQTTRKIRDLERQLIDELDSKKDVMARELTLTVETFHKEHPDAGARELQDVISSLLNKQLVTMANDESAKAKQASLVELKRRQKWMTAVSGALMGMALALTGEHVYFLLKNEASPLQRRVAAAQEEKKQDLEARKFNPPQTHEYKGTYADNVVYTEGFSDTYTSDDFQNKFLKAVAPYMLKTWKTDEDQVIQLLGISNTLVKSLTEKKQNIHPDFVPQGLDKMKEAETEATGRMRQLLGSQVRLESFKKFEKQFYEGYHPPAHAPASTPQE